jgi:hypothetical protein
MQIARVRDSLMTKMHPLPSLQLAPRNRALNAATKPNSPADETEIGTLLCSLALSSSGSVLPVSIWFGEVTVNLGAPSSLAWFRKQTIELQLSRQAHWGG